MLLWSCLGSHMTKSQYVMYFRFRGWWYRVFL